MSVRFPCHDSSLGALMMIALLAVEAGLPAGVLNTIHGNLAGIHICNRAAARGKQVQCNIEVKNHIVIMTDAIANVALDALVASSFGASGIEKFMAPTVVVFVGGSSPWENQLVDCAKLLKVNSGIESGADIGIVISKERNDQTCRLIQSVVLTGARLALDGRHIMTETLEEAIVIINCAKHGNKASIFTSSCVAARKFQDEVKTGLVGINVLSSFFLATFHVQWFRHFFHWRLLFIWGGGCTLLYSE